MGGLSIHIGTANSRQRIDEHALAYINAAGFVDNDLKNIINNVFLKIKRLKGFNTFNKIDVLKLRITDSEDNATALAQMGLNAVNPEENVSTFYNNPTANYYGLHFNGTTQYELSNWNPATSSKWLTTSALICEYVAFHDTGYYKTGMRNNGIATNRNIFLAQELTNPFVMGAGVNDSSAGVSVLTEEATAGFFAAFRNADDNNKYYFRNNDFQITQAGVFVTGVPNINLPIGARSLNGGISVDAFAEYRSQAFMVSTGMIRQEINEIQIILNKLQLDLDNLFGLSGVNQRRRYGYIPSVPLTNVSNNTAPTITAPLDPKAFDLIQVQNDGSWSGSETIVFTYQWQKNGVNIDGEINNSYTLAIGDDGEFSCLVTAANITSKLQVRSNVIEVAPQIEPINYYPPVLNGTGIEGDILTIIDPGTWGGYATINFQYQWQSNGIDIPGENNTIYTPTNDDVGNEISCVVTATNDYGSASESSATLTIIAASVAPTCNTAPVISGDDFIGGIIFLDNDGVWVGTDPIDYTYQWLSDGIGIPGEINNMFFPSDPVLVGTTISCRVFASNIAGANYADSNGISII